MRNILNILFCFLLFYSIGNAQSIKRNVISSYGFSFSTTNIILESTLGQPSNIGTVTDGSNYIRQGFQQPIFNLITIDGCTNTLASNYNPFATNDDGTCLYSSFVFGCTDPNASNFNPLATIDDGSCCYSSLSQLGQDIIGEAPYDYSGQAISLSSDGSIIAVGAPNNDDGGVSNSGHVRVYQDISGNWTQIGQDIDGGSSNSEYFGGAVSLSADGSILAIGAKYGANFNGSVKVYQNISGTWTQIGQQLDGVNQYDEFGCSVSLSEDGLKLAIGAYAVEVQHPLGPQYGYYNNVGTAQVYEYISGTWNQVCFIDGPTNNAGANFGRSVSLNFDGSILAVGAPGYYGLSSGAGLVRVYQDISGNWTQIGQDIDGDYVSGQTGMQVSIDSTGNFLAFSTPTYANGVDTAKVQVYQNISGVWTQIGQDILADDAYSYFGSALALNTRDASILVVGDYLAHGSNYLGVGSAKVFHNIAGLWTQSGNDIVGDSTYAQAGRSVALSSDGNKIFIGFDGAATTNGVYTGLVRQYSISDCDDYGCLDPLALNFDPNATIDDSSCVYPIYGCLDINATNYNLLANISDSSCIYIYGCMDSLASNYNPFAYFDDGTCLYSTFVFGCTDSTALNYDPLASVDDSSCCFNTGQLWSQIGQNIDGEAVGDQSGRYLSTNYDGSIVAIGAPFNDANGINSGHVRVYENISGTWSQIGQDIYGESSDDLSSLSISLSNDGYKLVIGAHMNDGNGSESGHARIYSYNGSSWIQLGQDINGEAIDDYSGHSVSISSDGNLLAIGAYGNDNNGTESGHARVYEYVGGFWQQIGLDIDGEAAIDLSGYSVSLDSNGSTVAVGAFRNDDNGDNAGHVRVYENNVGSWTQKGQDIDGEAVGDQSGRSVSLSSDGNTVAIGASYNDENGTESGHVRIYNYNGSSWIQLGQDINGEAIDDYSGSSVSLSSDGNIVAIGAPYNDGNGNVSGHSRIYKNIQGVWTQIGDDIDGEAIDDYSGWCLSLSKDGNIVAIGAPFNDSNGNNSGNVRVFEINSPCDDLGCLDPLALNFDPYATLDDSTCVYPNYGCIDSLAFNYNSLANISDSSCFYCYSSVTDTFFYTGGIQSFIVPDGVDSINVYLSGAQGYLGGLGGSIQADLLVKNDSIIYLYVGGQGTSQYGGWNGGGSSGSVSPGGGGGGASDIRIGGNSLYNRVMVSGAGGGYGTYGNGGLGGQNQNFYSFSAGNGTGQSPGWGATISSPGIGGVYFPWGSGNNGSLGIGGSYCSSCFNMSGGQGGGGAGYYGGGSGGASSGGGGGSNFSSSILTSNVFTYQGNNSGHGKIIISYSNTSTNTVLVTSCGSYIWDGVTYDSTGIYTNVYTGYNGCDSTVILNLTINQSSASTVNITACDSYDWDGFTYDSTGIYTNVYTGLNGCDSTVTLGLMINQSDSSYTNITACDSVEWNGEWYDSTGTYYSQFEMNNNYSINFDGINDDINIQGLFNPSEFTVGFWIKTNSNSYTQQVFRINFNNGQYFLLDINPNGEWYTSYSGGSVLNNNVFSDNSWHYITIKYLNGELYHYIDSSLTLQTNIGLWNTNSTLSSEIKIGVGTNYYMSGNIDGFCIWDIALSDQEIQEYMLCSPAGSESGIIGYWDFEEGSGNTVFDQTSNGNDGTINGATYDTNIPTQSCQLTNLSGCDSVAVLNLTINNSSSSSVTETSCDSLVWNGVTYTASGLYSYTTTNEYGCDSIVELDLTILNSSLNTYTFTITACDNYVWDGVTYDSTSQYVNVYTDVNGCDSTVTLDLTINYSSSNTLVITSCDSYVWDGVTYTLTGLYTNLYSDINGCDSTVTLDLIIVTPFLINENDTAICYGDSIILSVSEASFNACTLPLNLQSSLVSFYPFCGNANDESTFNNNGSVNGASLTNDRSSNPNSAYSFDGSNDYIDLGSPTSNSGSLTISSWVKTTNVVNDQRWIVSRSSWTTGAWQLMTWNGYAASEFDWGGQLVGGTFIADGQWHHILTIYDASTNYRYLYVDGIQDGIDMTRGTFNENGNQMMIGKRPGSGNTFNGDIDDVIIYNRVLTTNEIQELYNTSSPNNIAWSTGDLGLSITVSPTQTTSYWIETTDNGISCRDSITISVLDTSISAISVTSCDSYSWDGVTYYSTGQYTNIYTGLNGCDSLVILDLTINNSDTTTTAVNSCDSYTWDGVTYNSTGQYTNTYSSLSGCDSIVTLDLMINQSDTSYNNILACDFYTWDGVTYDSTGQYTNIYSALNGCDSIVILDLTINYLDTTTTAIIACDSYLWLGTTYTVSGIYDSLFTNINGYTNNYTNWDNSEPNNAGCNILDSANYAQMQSNGSWHDWCDDASLSPHYVLEIDSLLSTPVSNNYILLGNLNNSYYYLSNDTTTWTNANNLCITHGGNLLVIEDSTENYIIHSWIDLQYSTGGAWYTWIGFNDVNTEGQWEWVINNSINGCDSLVILDLTINNADTTTIAVNSCDSYTWDGVTYDSTGQYTNTYSSLSGCDSTAVLNLIINNSQTSSVSITACDSYFWDGISYDSSSIYTNIYSSLNGCDSTVTIDLTINNSTSFIDTIVACGSFSFNSVILTNPGIYSDTLNDLNGCDSIITIDLTFGIYGCMDTLAFNYDSLATCDDGSCVPIIYGCLDTSAVNYYPGANIDDNSCIYAGCMDTLASNYDSLATIDDGSCIYLNIGCTDSLACNYDPLADLDDGSCLADYGCMNSNALNYDSLATCSNDSCIFPIYGCTDTNAVNYYAGANVDDGGCLYAGCTDTLALNYDSIAFFDDGSCIYPQPCPSPKPTGLYAYDIIDTRAKIGWDNMNDSLCMVLKYFVRYRELGTNAWTTKSAGVGNGLCNFGLNTVIKQLLNLSASTTYEFKMKAFYCGGTSSNYSPTVQFTTLDVCPDMTNLSVQTFNGNQSKAKFTWDTTGVYTFARILLRVDTAGANWQTAGGFGVYFPTLFVNKFGLTTGQSYRAQGRTFCDSNITAYRSPTWTAPVFWTQPGNLPIRFQGGVSIEDLVIYPNPSRDLFNISFVSEEIQDLSIRIINMVGAEIYRENKEQFIGEYTKQISLNEYGKGVYFLEIETSNGIINKKLVLQ